MTSDQALFERINYGALSRLCDGFDTETYISLKKLAKKVHRHGKPQPKNTASTGQNNSKSYYVAM